MDRDFLVPAGIGPDATVRCDRTGGMEDLRQVPAGGSAGPLPVPPVLEASSTYLVPADLFPTALAELELAELQVLHSRITRQLEHEHIDLAGPNPVTLDRAQELAEELDTRQNFLTAAGSASPAARDADTTGTEASSVRPGPPAAQHALVNVTGQSPPSLPHPEEHPSGVLRAREDPTEAGARIHDLGQLRPGDRVQVWGSEHIQYIGTVEEAAPTLGVVWIREDLDAYRRMIHAQDTDLRCLQVRGGR